MAFVGLGPTSIHKLPSYTCNLPKLVLNLNIPVTPVGCCAVVPYGMMIPSVGPVPTIPLMYADPRTSNCALGTVPPKHRLVSVRLIDFPVRPRAYSAATSSAVRATFQSLKLEMEPLLYSALY